MSLSHTIKTLATGAPTLLTGGVPGARAGDERLIFQQPAFLSAQSLRVSSSAFEEGARMPTRFSADGQNISPPLSWSGLPVETQSLALIVEDPDAPLPNPFVHWLAWNIEPSTTALAEGVSPNEASMMSQGKNSGLKTGWTGMAPPKGDLPHHYHFQLFALNAKLDLEAGAGRGALIKAMEGKVIARGQTVGTFQR